MATDRQIAANRLNAALSTGPRTDEGKARSRANATRHGLAGELVPVEVAASAAFEARRASWGAEYRPVGEPAGWALDRAVAASLRIEDCERALVEVAAAARERASLAWDEDRAVEAAIVAARLGVDPVLASRQLRATLAGAELLVDAWLGLAEALEAGDDWSDSEASKALDLLGVATDLRSGRTLIDAGPGADPVAFHLGLALDEVDRLDALIERSLAPLDAMDRRVAIGGGSALLSKASRLVLRYEREAWRRYRESIRQVREPANPTVVVTPTPAPTPSPVVIRRPEVRERATAESSPSFEEERRALLDEAARLVGPVDRLGPMAADDDSAWLDALERRIEAECGPLDGDVRGTERTQFAGSTVTR